MKIHSMSDLHLEHQGGKWRDYAGAPEGTDVVVLAGDTHPGVLGLLWAAETFKNLDIVCVAGNHEFYSHRRLERHYEKMAAKAEELGINFLQNESVVIDSVRFVGGTLWTDFNLWGNQPEAMLQAPLPGMMNDYKQISQGKLKTTKLRPQTVLAEHKKTMEFLMDELGTDHDGPTVVVTHHAPSERSCLPEYRGDSDNVFYATALDRFVEMYAPALWLHGHIHQSRDYMIGETRVVCNPRGYYPLAINPNFDVNLLLEV